MEVYDSKVLLSPGPKSDFMGEVSGNDSLDGSSVGVTTLLHFVPLVV